MTRSPSLSSWTTVASKRRRSHLSLSFFFLLLSLSSPIMTWSKRTHYTNSLFYKAPKEDPYKVLGIPHASSLADVKKAYHKQALQKHPDKNPEKDHTKAADDFRRVLEAWEYLSNDNQKRTYDNLRKKQQKQRRTTMYYGQQQQQQSGHGHGQRTQTYRDSNGRTYTTYSSEHSNDSRNNKQKQQMDQPPPHFTFSSSQHKQQKHSSSSNAEFLQKVKELQSHVIKLSTWEQFQSQFLTRKKTQSQEKRGESLYFKKHFLGVFVARRKMEQYADEVLLFPYPFAGKIQNGRHSASAWDDILQTAKIRYNTPTPLTEAFGVPADKNSKNSNNKPFVVFGKQGDPVTKYRVYRFKAFTTKTPQEALQDWVMESLDCIVTVVNHHRQDVRIFRQPQYYLQTSSSNSKQKAREVGQPLPPGHQTTLKLKVTDRLIFMDVTTDQFYPTSTTSFHIDMLQDANIVNSIALSNVMVTQLEQLVEIGYGYTGTRKCYDRSVHCHGWATKMTIQTIKARQSNCDLFPEFGHNICPYSCGICTESHPVVNGVYYVLLHMPLHKIPTIPLRMVVEGTRASAKYLDVCLEDLYHMLEMRRNVAASFGLGGVLLGIQLALVAHMVIGSSFSSHHSVPMPGTADNNSNHHYLMMWLTLSLTFIAWGAWMLETSPSELPGSLKGFRKDLVWMVKNSMDSVYRLLYIGFLSVVLSTKLIDRFFARISSNAGVGGKRILHVLGLILISSMMLGVTTYVLQHDQAKSQRYLYWSEIWHLRKNAATMILAFGATLGSTILALRHLLRHASFTLIAASILNVALAVLGLVLASQDNFFHTDLNHVLTTRMSAAIPLALVGLFSGMTIVHFLATYKVKIKVD